MDRGSPPVGDSDPFPLDVELGEPAFMVVAMSLILALLRVLGATHPAYQAAAHLWIGGLIVAAWRGTTLAAAMLWVIVGALCLVELGCVLFGTAKVL